MSVIVISKYKPIPAGYSAVYIGRGSVFGNPFIMRDPSHQERVRVCKAFLTHLKKQWLDAKGGNISPLAQGVVDLSKRIKQGEKLALQCFCAPKQCHGDELKRTIEWLANK